MSRNGMLPRNRVIDTLAPSVALSASATGALFSATPPNFSGELQEASCSLQVSRGSQSDFFVQPFQHLLTA